MEKKILIEDSVIKTLKSEQYPESPITFLNQGILCFTREKLKGSATLFLSYSKIA